MMNWTQTLLEALGFRRYVILGTAGTIAAVLSGGYAYLRSRLQIDWLPDISVPVFFIMAILAILTITLLAYANDLRLRRLPRLKVLAVEILEVSGEQFIRVRIQNASTETIKELKPRIVGVRSSIEGVWKDGHTMDQHGFKHFTNFPVQIFTQERLKERLAGGDRAARPFNLSADEIRSLEIFQVTRPYGNFEIHFFDLPERHDLLTPEDITFDCEIHGAGLPTTFTVQYREISHSKSGYSVTLRDDKHVDTKTFQPEESVETEEVPYPIVFRGD